jgi:hypothetical protein
MGDKSSQLMIAITVAGLLGTWVCTSSNTPAQRRVVVYGSHGRLRSWVIGEHPVVEMGSYQVDAGQTAPAEVGTVTERSNVGTERLTLRITRNSIEQLGVEFLRGPDWVTPPTQYDTTCVRSASRRP